MKRILILALAAVMLVSLLTACSATGMVTDPYGGYSNVSTTDDGTVNGTNYPNQYGYQNGPQGAGRSNSSGSYNNYGSGSGSSYNNGSYQNGRAGSYNGYQNGSGYTGTTSGTGMQGNP